MEEKARAGLNFLRKDDKGRILLASHADHKHEADNINNELKAENVHWFNPDFGIVDFDGSDDFERQFYAKAYSGYVEHHNEQAKKNRHMDRFWDDGAEHLRHHEDYCPMQAITYFGDRDHALSKDQFLDCWKDFFNWFKESFPQIKIMDWHLHMDEGTWENGKWIPGAPHVDWHIAPMALDRNGNFYPSMSKALQQMGFKQHNKQYDNAMMQFTALCRKKEQEIMKAHGIDIEEIPRERSKSGKSLKAYKENKTAERLDEQMNRLIPGFMIEQYLSKAQPSKLKKGFMIISEEDFKQLAYTAALADKQKLDSWRAAQPLAQQQKESLLYEINELKYEQRFSENERKIQASINRSDLQQFFENHGINWDDFKLFLSQQESKRSLNQGIERASINKRMRDLESQDLDEIERE